MNNTKTIEVTDRDDIRTGDTMVVVVTDVGTNTYDGRMDYHIVSVTREVPAWDIGTPGTATITCDEDGPRPAHGVIGPDGMFACVTDSGAHIAHEGQWSDFMPQTMPTFSQIRAALAQSDAAQNNLTSSEVEEQAYAVLTMIKERGQQQ